MPTIALPYDTNRPLPVRIPERNFVGVASRYLGSYRVSGGVGGDSAWKSENGSLCRLRSRELGTEFLKDLEPIIYRRYLDFATVEGLRHMKARIHQEPLSPSRSEVMPTPIAMTPVANFEIGSDQDTVYVINDNEGRQFDFEKLAQGETWVTREALAKIDVNDPPIAPGGAVDRRALASVKPTDVLVLGIRTWPVGVNAVLLRVEGRSALYSLGFLLRRGLAARLCGEAKASQILVSSRVAGTVEDLIDLEEMETLTLKGFLKPAPTFNVVGLKASG